MAAKTTEQSTKLKELLPHATTTAPDPLLQKLATAPEPESDRTPHWLLKLRTSFLVELFACFVVFHVLNIIVAMGGVLIAVAMLTSVALAPGWFALFAYGMLANMLGVCILISIRPDWLQVLALIALLLLWCGSAFNTYTFIILIWIPLVAFIMVIAELLLYSIGYGVMIVLVEDDVGLAQFADDVIASDAPAGIRGLGPETCVDRFDFPDPFDKLKFFSPHITLTREIWVLIFYFAVLKVVVGVLSALVLVFVLIQPIAAICTLGHDPFLGYWIDPQVSPLVYSMTIVMLWVIGVSGLQPVAKLTVKFTELVCGLLKMDKTENRGEIDPAVSSTPQQEPSTGSFTQI